MELRQQISDLQIKIVSLEEQLEKQDKQKRNEMQARPQIDLENKAEIIKL